MSKEYVSKDTVIRLYQMFNVGETKLSTTTFANLIDNLPNELPDDYYVISGTELFDYIRESIRCEAANKAYILFDATVSGKYDAKIENYIRNHKDINGEPATSYSEIAEVEMQKYKQVKDYDIDVDWPRT